MVKSVRLACLMCAASVYPEPGSNSLVIVSIFYSIFRLNLYKSFSKKFFSSSFKLLPFLLVKKLLKISFSYLFYFHKTFRFGFFSKGFYCLLFNVLLLFVLTFSVVRTMCIILYHFFFVNTFFDIFQKNFSTLF